jgi:hypothetical protein
VRWKLLIITSLVAALVNAGGYLALAYRTGGLSNPLRPLQFPLAVAYVFPLALITLAGIFVYRHTARRRKLQATATVCLSLILTLALLFALRELLARPTGGASEPAATSRPAA